MGGQDKLPVQWEKWIVIYFALIGWPPASLRSFNSSKNSFLILPSSVSARTAAVTLFSHVIKALILNLLDANNWVVNQRENLEDIFGWLFDVRRMFCVVGLKIFYSNRTLTSTWQINFFILIHITGRKHDCRDF